MKSHRAFTLIELLVVIAILGILMALLFPAVDGALEGARRAQASNDVSQIATAVTAFETEYGAIPSAWTSKTDVDKDILDALTGVAGNTDNPRQITFLEVQAYKKGRGGLLNNKFVDPWGGPYQITFDADYDNRISAASAGESTYGTQPSSDLLKRVAVWNDPGQGLDAAKTSTAKKKRRAVTSW